MDYHQQVRVLLSRSDQHPTSDTKARIKKNHEIVRKQLDKVMHRDLCLVTQILVIKQHTKAVKVMKLSSQEMFLAEGENCRSIANR